MKGKYNVTNRYNKNNRMHTRITGLGRLDWKKNA